MSHHSDDQMLIASTDSFWEPGNYKRTTKRIEDGHKLCDSLIALVQERSEIEKNYAKALKSWSKNWNDKIEKGPEYGTTEAACKGVLNEADRLCDLHLKVKDDLCNDAITKIKNWQKDTYHKSMMTLKERKDMDDAFKKAQKPWAKLLQKVEKSKSEFHNSCKTERTAANMERNASADSSLSPDQVKKMQDRVQKTKEEVQKAKEKYESALQEINLYNPKYMEDMTQVFDKCQQMEAQRLEFFKKVLFDIHKCLNISQDPELPKIYEELYQTINSTDAEKDLRWWSNNHGVNMAMGWPEFEDYTEEFRDIAKGSKSKDALPAGSITLINQRPVGEDLHELPTSNKAKPKARVISTTTMTTSTDGSSNGEGKASATNDRIAKQVSADKNSNAGIPHDNNSISRNSSITNGGSNAKAESNPFDEEEWDEDGGEPLVDHGEPGVPVKALYDYDGAEADELSFKQGEMFEKLEEEDEQGWCKGRKDGRVGLYPANYADVVAQ